MKRLLITSLFIMQISCASDSGSPLKTNPALENTDWQLAYFFDESGKSLPVLSDTTISAAFSKSKITGRGGCNRYFGKYQLADGGSLSMPGSMGATMMACRAEVNAQEQRYFKQLAKIAYYQLDNNALTLLDKKQLAVLKFKPAIAASLENTLWQVTGINNGKGGVVSDKNTRLATAQFVNGEVHGQASCNQFSATYTIKDQQLTIGQARTTRKFCPEAGVNEQESNYLKALTQVSHYVISAETLELRDTKGSLMVSFKKQK
ncbi:MAG: META domain-containing protein [Methylovulum sp.]